MQRSAVVEHSKSLKRARSVPQRGSLLDKTTRASAKAEAPPIAHLADPHSLVPSLGAQPPAMAAAHGPWRPPAKSSVASSASLDRAHRVARTHQDRWCWLP